MSRRPFINLGDLFVACAHTGAADPVSVQRIAHMLGLITNDERASWEARAAESLPEDTSERSNTPAATELSQQSGSSEPPPSPTGGEPISIAAVTEPVYKQPVPAWFGHQQQQQQQPPPPVVSQHRVSLELKPLFHPSWTRNLIVSTVSTLRPEGPLQLDALVELLAERQPIRCIPRQLRPTLRTGAQVLVDLSEAMEPFSRDVEYLLKRIQAVVGHEQINILFFDSSPQRTGVGSRRDWQEHRFPPAGTPILALTCLGINAPPYHTYAVALAWQRFAGAARAARCPLVATVPYPAYRWPEGLSARMMIIEWDRGTTVGYVRRLVRRRNRTT